MFKYFQTSAILLLLGILPCYLAAQTLGDFQYDESKLYAETKQINQFFRRFNGEEDKMGERLYKKDKDFHSRKLRKKYMDLLYNLDNSILTDAVKEKFNKIIEHRKLTFEVFFEN